MQRTRIDTLPPKAKLVSSPCGGHNKASPGELKLLAGGCIYSDDDNPITSVKVLNGKKKADDEHVV